MQDSSWAVGWQHFPNLFPEKHEIEKIWVRRIRGGWMGASGLPRSTNVNYLCSQKVLNSNVKVFNVFVKQK